MYYKFILKSYIFYQKFNKFPLISFSSSRKIILNILKIFIEKILNLNLKKKFSSLSFIKNETKNKELKIEWKMRKNFLKLNLLIKYLKFCIFIKLN